MILLKLFIYTLGAAWTALGILHWNTWDGDWIYFLAAWVTMRGMWHAPWTVEKNTEIGD
jgi:hypothetical protein